MNTWTDAEYREAFLDGIAAGLQPLSLAKQASALIQLMAWDDAGMQKTAAGGLGDTLTNASTQAQGWLKSNPAAATGIGAGIASAGAGALYTALRGKSEEEKKTGKPWLRNILGAGLGGGLATYAGMNMDKIRGMFQPKQPEVTAADVPGIEANARAQAANAQAGRPSVDSGLKG